MQGKMEKEITMEVEFKIKLKEEKKIKELCALFDKWHKEIKNGKKLK